MTEILEMKAISKVEQRFILHWGEMGTQWGINRTVAQIHALLFIAKEPLDAETISNVLGVARSNVSTSIKELLGWGIIRRVHKMGDKRDHFESIQDVWELFRLVLDERKKREIDPTLSVLRQCLIEAEDDGETSAHTRSRLKELTQFLETTTGWYAMISRWPAKAIHGLFRMGDKLRRQLNLG